MKDWSTACPDWRERIVAARSLIPFDPLYPDEADAGLAVYNDLYVADLAGPGKPTPTMKEISRDWIKDFVKSIFGAYDADAGRRLITEFFLLISKKNTKSTSAAGIMLTALIRNWRESAEFLILAPTIEIANNSFLPAREMVKRDDTLSALLHVQDHYRTITHRQTGALLKVVAADNDTVSGKKATGVLIDELWLFGKRAHADNMIREATGGLASRPEGFTIFLSTQSDEPPAGVFKQKLQYARDVRDGRVIDRRFLPVLYEFPEDMIARGEHRDPKNFYVTNPNLGASVDVEFIEREFAKAVVEGEKDVRGFLAKHLNVEIGLALMGDNWPGARFWEAQASKEGLSLEQLLAASDVVTVGGDGGGLDDLLGLAVIGRERGSGRILVWTRAWAHPIVLETRKSIASALRDFEKEGSLKLSERIGEDVEELADIVHQVYATGLLPEKEAIGLDPAGIGGVVDAIVAKGVPFEAIIGIAQGWQMAGAVKTTERKLAGGTMVHGGTKLMNWCVGNAKTEQRANGYIVTKQASGKAKIDPLMALFDAVALMNRNPVAAGEKKPQLLFV